MLRITAGSEGRVVDMETAVLPPPGRDRELLQFGPFPDLLPAPPSPLRIL
jgi:hypothetical protein